MIHRAFLALAVIGAVGCGGKVDVGNGGDDAGAGGTGVAPEGGVPESSSPCAPPQGPIDCYDECTQQMYAPECVNGQWACPHDHPGGCPDASDCCPMGADCVDPCTGNMYGPSCVNGQCVCDHQYPNGCPDAGDCCSGAPTDCWDGCTGGMYAPECVNGQCVCTHQYPNGCPDAGVNPGDCLFMAADPTCDACLQAKCIDQCVACSLNPACVDYAVCLFDCVDTDQCLQECGAQHPDGLADFEAFIGQQGCVYSSCAGECALP